MVVGATADVAKQSDPALAQAEVLRAKAAGFTAIRLTQHWLPGEVEPPGGELAALRNAVFAATANQLQSDVVVSHPGSRTTPLTDQSRKEFAQFLAALAKALPAVRHYIDRQRAEPERLLAAAVRAERRERRRARVPRTAGARPTTR